MHIAAIDDQSLPPLKRARKSVLIEYLWRTSFNQTETCNLLGIRESTLISWMRKYKIERPHTQVSGETDFSTCR